MNYADVIVDISLEKLDKTFQYAIPKELQSVVVPGTRVVLPFGNGGRRLKGYVVELSDEPKLAPERIKTLLGVDEGSIAIESQMIALAAWMKRHYGSTMNQALKTVLPVKKREKNREKKRIVLALSKEETGRVYEKLTARKRHSMAKERLLLALRERGSVSWEEATGPLQASAAAIRDMQQSGWIEIQRLRDYRNPISLPKEEPKHIILNEDQKEACRCVIEDMQQGIAGTYLLYGVTGSGKTQVYMELIDYTLRQGKSAICLVPEIALTYQTVMRFYRRFGDRVSFLHSRMTPGERYDQFERARNGEVQIMMGPRSALFTPFANLGLVILDEEHESSYKSETAPRYHARETAVARAKMCGASVVLGSATPSLESFLRAKEGSYRLLTLPHRVEDKPLPDCEVVDLREELFAGNRSILSRRLVELMQDRLEKKEQMMLFLNRRGMMGFLSCRACGHVIKCPHCDVSLSLHRGGRMRCHYCGFEAPRPTVCPSCGSKYIGGFKAGTQKAEEVVQSLFPQAKVLRMDMDTTRGKEGHQKILEAFAKREADILIGTQMIVKGHDFPGVTLVGILAADLSLNAGDFRSGERTFQLLTQAAGRAGRGAVSGNVIIQTYQPKHYSILAACRQDYDGFYAQEIMFRRMMHYPPAGHMLVILGVSASYEAAVQQMDAIAALLRQKDAKMLLLGPADAAIGRINDMYRRTIYIKHEDYEYLIDCKDSVEAYLLQAKGYSNVNIWFDFDPIGSF